MLRVQSGLFNVADRIREISDVKAYAIVRRDGMIIAHGLENSGDPKVVAAMTAAIFGTAELATEHLRQGRFLRTIVECENGKILITGAGRHALLLSLVFSDANLGLVLLQLEKTGARIAEILDRDPNPRAIIDSKNDEGFVQDVS